MIRVAMFELRQLKYECGREQGKELCVQKKEERSRSQQAAGKMAQVWIMGRSARCTRKEL